MDQVGLYVGQKMLKMKLPGTRRRRPKRRFIDVVREDMRVVGLTEEEQVTWPAKWKKTFCCGDP